MQDVSSILFVTLVLFSYAKHGLALDVYLVNITIYTDHEKSIPFVTNHPEVYLSCDDGRPTIDLGHVNDENRNYAFNPGEVLATTVERDGPCIDCTLKEEDPSVLKDDTFGDFPLCWHQFSETGDYIAFVPGQFRMGFQCMDCVENDVAPAPEPEGVPFEFVPVPEPEGEDQLDFEIPTPVPSLPEIEKDDEDDVTGQYYYFTPGRTFSVENGEEPVELQSGDVEQNNASESKSSNGLSVATVLSLCFVFLVVGVGLGVVVFRKYSERAANDRATMTAMEMTKAAFMKGKV